MPSCNRGSRSTSPPTSCSATGPEVEITQGDVILSKSGPRGGTPHRIVIPRGQWPSVVAAVEQVQEAIGKAEAMKREVESGSA